MEKTVKKRKLSASRAEAIAGVLFASPWILGFLIFTAYPIIASLVYSFTDFNSFTVTRVGFFNFETIFRDVFARDAFRNTLIFVAINVPVSTVLGILFGWLLTRKTFGQRLYRTIYYIPAVVSIVAIVFLWRFMLDQSDGLINNFLGIFRISGPAWLDNPNWIMPALLMMSAWGVGGTIILYLTAISNVPVDQLEAAEIDGAGGFRKFINITLPTISPVISFNILMGLIGGFQYFLPAYIMTAGGPGRSGTFVGQIIYENAFRQWNMGYASAISWVMMIMIFCVTLIYLKLSKRFVHYSS